jgi:hypothetical protein
VLATRGHAEALQAASVILYALLAAWLVVAAHRAGQHHRPSVPPYDHHGADRLTPGPRPGLRSADGCRYGTIMSGTGE